MLAMIATYPTTIALMLTKTGKIQQKRHLLEKREWSTMENQTI